MQTKPLVHLVTRNSVFQLGKRSTQGNHSPFDRMRVNVGNLAQGLGHAFSIAFQGANAMQHLALQVAKHSWSIRYAHCITSSLFRRKPSSLGEELRVQAARDIRADDGNDNSQPSSQIEIVPKSQGQQ